MLEQKIKNHSAKIGIIGLGYVGLPLALKFTAKGFKVFGVDTDSKKVGMLKSGKSYVSDVSAANIKQAVKSKNLVPGVSYGVLSSVDAIIICVPTPLRKTREPDISFILSAVSEIKKVIRAGQLIILESTTYPGTTREILLGEFGAKKGLVCGKNLFLAFSPERVDPGNKTYDISNTPKIIGGITKTCARLAGMLYSGVVKKVITVSSPEAAEMVKLLENTFRSVNIALINEVALMCSRLKLDVWEIIDAAASKPYGFMTFYPGPGIGGHCIPLDPLYLSWKLKSLNFNSRFIELATDINSKMPEFVVERLSAMLNERGKPLKNSRIFILGAAYKPDVSDIRESPALDIMELLIHRGALVYYNDPYVDRLTLISGKTLHSAPVSGISKSDCTLIVTNHSAYNYADIVRKSRVVLDTRNATRGISDRKIIKL